MTISARTLCTVVSLLIVSSFAYGNYIETFDGGTNDWQAWQLNNRGRTRHVSPTHTDTGTDQFISMSVDNSNWRAWGLQPVDASDYGDMTGMKLTVDFLLDGVIDGPTGSPTVRFYVGANKGGKNDYFVTHDAFSWNPNDDAAGWGTHEVDLSVENFAEWPNAAAHSRTFEQVIADADDIGLVFTGNMGSFRSNRKLGFSSRQGATMHVDNFGTRPAGVPEPGTMALLSVGALGMILPRRNRK
jgi:hypothetical protein